jgi:tripartite-type tricarboxylate transporter receptor subunit TctC
MFSIAATLSSSLLLVLQAVLGRRPASTIRAAATFPALLATMLPVMLASVLAFGLAFMPASAHAGRGPECSLTRMIIAYPAGGPTDALGRLVAQKLGEKWGRSIVVENRGGGGTVIATDLVARSKPDGCTMLLTASPFANNPSIFPKLPYDTEKDLAPVSMIVLSPQILVVHPELKVSSVKELLEFAKANPGQFSYASSGNLGTGHLSGELLSTMSGLDLLHIPYKGSAPAHLDVVSGRVPAMFDSGGPMLGLIEAGRVKALAVTTATRSSQLPDVPTVAESGVPGYEVASWNGIVTTGGTARDIVAAMADDINEVIRQSDVRERLATMSYEVVGTTPAEFEAFVRKEAKRWGDVIRSRGLKSE